MKGRITTSHLSNYFGEGYQKNITFEDGSSYIIRNTHKSNYFGDKGYQQEIVPTESSTSQMSLGYALIVLWYAVGFCEIVAHFWLGLGIFVALDAAVTIAFNYRVRPISIFSLLFPTIAIFFIPVTLYLAYLSVQ